MVKNPLANAGDIRDSVLIPGSGKSPGEGNIYPLQYSCLENSMDKEPWAPGIQSRDLKESDTTEKLTFPFSLFT